jgi:KipI family sensor histidine kinase inhibitor
VADPVQILSQGANGVVIRFATKLSDAANRATIAFAASLLENSPVGMEECSPALASVYVRFDPGKTGYAEIAEDLRKRLEARDFFAANLPPNRTLWRVPTVFGGELAPGLEEAAVEAGLSVDDAVAALTAQSVRVLAIGYAPGQPYLGELPEAFDIPRLPDLIDVPKAAVVLAIRQLVIFANGSPTGWRHIGQTAFPLFQPDAETPITLNPGDEVLLEAVTQDQLEVSQAMPMGGATAEPLG